jgi:hypothetical protein
MRMQGIIFAKFEERKIVEYWMMTDQFDQLQQLGIIPRYIDSLGILEKTKDLT